MANKKDYQETRKVAADLTDLTKWGSRITYDPDGVTPADFFILESELKSATLQTAAQVVFTPADSITATNAQAAIVEALTDAKAYADTLAAAVGGAVILKGSWDASSGSFPNTANRLAGWSWIVSVGGTVDGVTFNANDRIIAIVDNASTTVFAANWFKADYTDQVLSVNGATGVVSGLEATANKDATGGYAGLTLFKINFKNAANTFTNFLTNATTAARTWTFPDKDGTVAMTSDITGTNSGTNTGDQTATTLPFTPAGDIAATDAQAAIVEALTDAKAYSDTLAAAVGGAVILKGTWDASAGTFPGSALQKAGWSYIVSVGGTVGGQTFAVNDRLIAIADNASTTVFAANWFKADYTDQVLSVNGLTGAVSILPDVQATYQTIASAATTNIGALTTQNVNISGTATITAFDTVVAGITRKCVATGAFTLTHNATSLICPSAANIVCAAGDTFEAISLGSGSWKIFDFQRANGTALVSYAPGSAPGEVVESFTYTPPAGTLVLDGRAVSRTTYAALFAILGVAYGVGDGSTTFNLPSSAKELLANQEVAGTALTAIRHYHTATLLGDGRVMLVGGYVASTESTSVVFLTISGNTITEVAGTALTATRYYHRATLLGDGRVMLVGGVVAGAASTSVVFLTISGNTITEVAGTALTATRYVHTATLLGDGRVMLVGGLVAGVESASVVFLTISGNTITEVAGTSLTATRYYHTATLLGDGRVMLVGGLVAGVASASVVFLTISGNTITEVAGTSLTATRYAYAATLLGDGRVMLVGGQVAGVASTSVVFLTISGNTITEVAGTSLTATRYYHTATLLGDGRVMLAAGYVAGAASTSVVFYINNYLQKYVYV
jgi:microcystin-dependent protein